ncbi:MAG: glycosyltransferase family protein [Chitinophagaceae bacterium]
MKIFYAVQATGNGHIARAIELLPYLRKHGKVDIFLSGNNANLQGGLTPSFVSKGLSLHYANNGGLDYGKMVKQFALRRMLREAKSLPLKAYDLVINDFEPITALAAKRQKVPSIGFGHQASFQSDFVPRPIRKSTIGEWVLKHYAPATAYIGLHFEQYDDFIYGPVIKDAIEKAKPENHGHITVYLPHYHDQLLKNLFLQIPEYRFEIFSRNMQVVVEDRNIVFRPISNQHFTQSLIHCHGVLTGGGFETPAEALYLRKKLMVVPIRGQYEQQCNGAALAQMGIPIVHQLDAGCIPVFRNWLEQVSMQNDIPFVRKELLIDQLLQRAAALC